MPTKAQTYELESLLWDVVDKGFVIIHISKLWRLLDKGSRAAGTWKALLDAWDEIDHGKERSDLHIFEAKHEYLVISATPSELIVTKAGERG